MKSTDFVGSSILPFRGTLTASVTPAGKLTLAYKGQSIAKLKAGRYTISVTDKSTTIGFVRRPEKPRHATMNITGRSFVGKQSAKVELTAGKWVFTPSGGKQSYTIPSSPPSDAAARATLAAAAAAAVLAAVGLSSGVATSRRRRPPALSLPARGLGHEEHKRGRYLRAPLRVRCVEQDRAAEHGDREDRDALLARSRTGRHGYLGVRFSGHQVWTVVRKQIPFLSTEGTRRSRYQEIRAGSVTSARA